MKAARFYEKHKLIVEDIPAVFEQRPCARDGKVPVKCRADAD